MLIRLLNTLLHATARIITGGRVVARVWNKRISDWFIPVRQFIPIHWMYGYGRACLVSMMLLLPSIVQAVPVGTVISNTAQADYGFGGVPQTTFSNSITTTTVALRTNATVEFLQYSAGSTSTETLSVTDYSTSGSSAGSFAALAAPTALGGTTPIDLNLPVPVAPVSVYHQGEPLIIRLTDVDQNLNSLAAETILITLTTSAGDSVIIRLTETGLDTGVFTGYIASQGGVAVTSNDNVISLDPEVTVTASYVDVVDGSDTSTASVLVDPFGVVFDSVTGLPVDGVQVTMIDVATGLPATVYGDDGVSAYPATVVTGGNVTDSGGNVYNLPPGGYRFPFVTPGTYRFDVVPVSGYSMPSTVPTADLQLLAGAPFAITIGSRGEDFVVNPGPALHIDIPVDPGISGLFVEKTTTAKNVSIGDYIPYGISVQNTTATTLNGVFVDDYLPMGFRYRPGSLLVNGVGVTEPTIASDGRSLNIQLGDIPSANIVNISYVAEVGVAAVTGPAINEAVAQTAGGLLSSNLAQARVDVEELFMREHNVLVGRVIVGECDAEVSEDVNNGAAGIRIYMEDGRYVVTDKKGRFHFEGIKPGSHVVQLDEDSLHEKYEPIICNEHSQFSGRAYSRFVDLQGGTMWRTDFHLVLKPALESDVTLQLNAELKEKSIRYTLDLNGGEVDLDKRILTVVMPESVHYVPQSSVMDGATMGEPEVRGNILTYRLGDSVGAWSGKIEFNAEVRARDMPSALLTKAVLNFSTPTANSVRTPLAETLLTPPVKERVVSDVVLKSHFDSFEASITLQKEIQALENIMETLRGRDQIKIQAVGHTDSLPIAKRSRSVYKNNYILSQARANTIARYLSERLNLPPSRITSIGMGPDKPIADNNTPAGRQKNRRVELIVVTDKTRAADISSMASSPLQSVKAKGLRPGEVSDKNVSPTATSTEQVASELIPSFDKAWLAQAETGQEWLWPGDGHHPAIPSTKIIIKHSVGEKPTLLLDGKEVNALNFEGARTNKKRDVATSQWSGVDLEMGKNHFEVIFQDADGKESGRLEHVVYVANPPVAAEFVPELSTLIADGKTPPVMAIRLTDLQGHPARQGVVGTFSVAEPYRVYEDKEVSQIMLQDFSKRRVQYRVGEDGVALVELEPTTRTGEVVVNFPFENSDEDVRAWLEPDARDWILVGIAEGTTGYGSISGNMQALDANDYEDELYSDGRVALFAKGRIAGDLLLTMSYDTAKEKQPGQERLFQTIDPDEYYTLYGDTTEQGYEAASTKKLYLKIERQQFYAMFGDYTTGLTVSELSRYERSLTGIKSELNTEKYGYNVFASETNSSFAKDEIQGDGTSGLYRLSRGDIVINSDEIAIETRDRFRSEVIISSQLLKRHIDYSIDFSDGTLYFKLPVPSRDANFNPIYIVANYETNQGGEDLLSAGGRGYVKPTDDLEIGVSHISEEQVGGTGKLSGIDATIELGRGTQLLAEISTSKDAAGVDADAHLAELQHRSGKVDGRIYHIQRDDGFGLGQQRGSENATRKMGFDGSYLLNEHTTINSDVYRQDNLTTGAERDVVEADVDYQYDRYQFDVGARSAKDSFDNGDINRSDQLTLGASTRFFDNRMSVHIRREQSLSNNANVDFPTRTSIGADYRITQSLTLFAEQEFSDGDNNKSQNTRAGLSATPWTGGTVNASMSREFDENGERVFANTGLNQRWTLTERWSVDASIDRSETLEDSSTPFNVNVPPTTGTAGNDFLAVSTGVNYRRDTWSWSTRLEQRIADTEHKKGIYSGIAGEVNEGLGMSLRLQLFDTDRSTGEQLRESQLRYGLAYRPLNTRWIILNRSDYDVEKQTGGGPGFENWKLVNNTNFNYKKNGMQVDLHYGAKYVQSTFDSLNYSGYTDLLGIEYRRDLSKIFDLGAHANMLNSRQLNQILYSYGLSLGLNAADNMWISFGYNWDGFEDNDFTAAGYTADGPYIKLRFKFDQHSVRSAVDWFNKQ